MMVQKHVGVFTKSPPPKFAIWSPTERFAVNLRPEVRKIRNDAPEPRFRFIVIGINTSKSTMLTRFFEEIFELLTSDNAIEHLEDFVSTTRRARSAQQATITELFSARIAKAVTAIPKHAFST